MTIRCYRSVFCYFPQRNSYLIPFLGFQQELPRLSTTFQYSLDRQLSTSPVAPLPKRFPTRFILNSFLKRPALSIRSIPYLKSSVPLLSNFNHRAMSNETSSTLRDRAALVLSWLAPEEAKPPKNYLPSTCEWITHVDEYDHWKRDNTQRLLWIHGPAGINSSIPLSYP